MMPVYRDMNMYPHQMSPHGYYRLGYPYRPHQMGLDSSMPVSCEYWPNRGGHGLPMPCYGYCVPGNFHGCNGFRPFYPPQVPHHPCCGSYSDFHPVHHSPAYYIPPHVPFDHQPRFEYDKDLARDRNCSECPNHVCDRRNGNAIRIEEHEPETEKENRGKSVVPVQSTGFPFPIVWVPHESVKKQDHERPVGSEGEITAEAKAYEDTKVLEKDGRFPPLVQDALRETIRASGTEFRRARTELKERRSKGPTENYSCETNRGSGTKFN